MIFDASVHKKTFRFPEFLPYRCQKYPTCKEGSDARCHCIVNSTVPLPIANITSRVGVYKNLYPISAKMYAQYTKKAELTRARLQLYEVNPKKLGQTIYMSCHLRFQISGFVAMYYIFLGKLIHH